MAIHPGQSDLFTRKAIRDALKLWSNSQKLGQHPLVQLRLVAERRQQAQHADTAAGRGVALRHILRQAIESLRPTGEEPDFTHRAWRHYYILHEQYLQEQRAQDLQELMGISESGYFTDQREALDRLGNWLREREEALNNLPPAIQMFVPPPTAANPQLPPSNLPRPLTPFIGRSAERSQIAQWLADGGCRLISIIGTGGMGKTRLAIQAAEESALTPYFIALDTIETADLLIPTLAQTLQLTLDTQRAGAPQVHHFLRNKQVLLVLDNFEHLTEQGAEVISALLVNAPQVKLLVTSRERLQVRGEWVIELHGLDVPTAVASRLEIEQFSAVQLFQQALERVRAGQATLPADWPHIATICQLVEGMPLGLELAASWGSVMPCAEIAAEIQTNLDFLASAYRDLPERHRSLRAVFHHSWALLTAEEQAIFRQLAIFKGSFERRAALAVAGASLPVLHALSGKSLLRATETGRYAIHPLLRQYAHEKLAAVPEAWSAVQTAHGRYYLQQMAQQAAGLKQGGQQPAQLQQVEQELENVRAAWRWAVEVGESALLIQAAEGLYLWFAMTNRAQEGSDTLGGVVEWLAHTAVPDHTQHQLWGLAQGLQARFALLLGHSGRARVAFQQALERLRQYGRPSHIALISMLAIEADLPTAGYRPAQLYGESLAFFEQTADQWGIASAHMRFVTHLRQMGASDSYGQQKALLRQSLAIREQIGDQRGVANALNYLCDLAYERGDYDEARQLAERSLALHRTLGDHIGSAHSLNHLGQVVGTLGQYEAARAFYQESLAILRQYANAREVAVCLDCVGYVTYLLEDYDTAARHYEESLHISREAGDVHGTAWSLHNMGDIARAHGQYEKAKALYTESLELHKSLDALSWGGMVALDKLGRVSLALRQETAAQGYFLEALSMATAANRNREVLDALLNLAELLLRKGEKGGAAELLTVVAQHPATAKQTLDKALDYLPNLPMVADRPSLEAVVGKLVGDVVSGER